MGNMAGLIWSRGLFWSEKSKIVERWVHREETIVKLADDDIDGTLIAK